MSLAVVHKEMETEIKRWLRLERKKPTRTFYEESCFLHKRNESCIVKKAFGKGKRLAHDHKRYYTLHRRHANLSFLQHDKVRPCSDVACYRDTILERAEMEYPYLLLTRIMPNGLFKPSHTLQLLSRSSVPRAHFTTHVLRRHDESLVALELVHNCF
jgi:hypothetical protein